MGFVNSLEDLGMLTLAQVNLAIKYVRGKAKMALLNSKIQSKMNAEGEKFKLDFDPSNLE